MKVCHLSSAHGQEDIRIFYKECVSLAKAGYDVYEITKGKTYEKQGIHICGVESAGEHRFKRMFGTTQNVYKKALEIDADVYHAHDPELIPVLLKLKRKRKKVIFDSHEHTVGTIEEKTYIPKWFRKIVQCVYEIYQTHACRKLDAVVTATPNITDYFRSVGCKRVVDLCNFPILEGAFCKPEYTSKKISFAGGISKQWNHEYIIKALSEIPDVKYVLCGTAKNNYLEKLKMTEGWDKVDFRGRLSFEEIPQVLRSTAVGLSLLTPGANTDWYNGNMANTKIFEEMMAGLPVICTNFERWKEFVEKYDCGICINPQDEKEIATAIIYLINNPDIAQTKGLNGRKAIEEKYNWAIEEKKLLALYKELEGE